MTSVPALCLHCEQQPPASGYGLCAGCRKRPAISVLYRRRAGWSPAWEAHLRRLTERARLRLPLFPASDDEPPVASSCA